MQEQRLEIRDRTGALVAVLDRLEPLDGAEAGGMIELAADVAGASYRLRIFPASARQKLLAAA